MYKQKFSEKFSNRAFDDKEEQKMKIDKFINMSSIDKLFSAYDLLKLLGNKDLFFSNLRIFSKSNIIINLLKIFTSWARLMGHLQCFRVPSQ